MACSIPSAAPRSAVRWSRWLSLQVRMTDALVERVSGGKPANLQVTATIETLKGLAGAAGAEMEFSLPISSTSVQRMPCDCSVTRVLLSQDSMPVDVGRSKRVISGALGRALKARRELPLARLRTLRLDVRWTSPRALDRRRSERPRQPGPALPAAPSDGA